MGDASNRLLKLRPVSFRYKQDPTKSLQYGLIAEQVERVYPELVTHDDHDKVMGVRYDMLPALLLNEVQKLERENRRKDDQIAAQQKQIGALQQEAAQIDRLTARLNILEEQTSKPKSERLVSVLQ